MNLEPISVISYDKKRLVLFRVAFHACNILAYSKLCFKPVAGFAGIARSSVADVKIRLPYNSLLRGFQLNSPKSFIIGQYFY